MTRPALAAVAALAIAASAVPATVHLTANGAPETETARIAAAQSTTQATVPATTTSADTTTPAETATAEPSAQAPATETAAQPDAAGDQDVVTITEVVDETATVDENGEPVGDDPALGASKPTGEEGDLDKVIDDALAGPETDPGKRDNMPKEDGVSHGDVDAVKPLSLNLPSTDGGQQVWVDKVKRHSNGEALQVFSPSMDRDIPVAVFRATDENGQHIENAPTYYLLNGAGGSEQNTDWIAQAASQVHEVLLDEPVNVVIPMEGAFSYYVDWLTEPSQNRYLKGKQMWSTFLAEELPQSIEPYLNANGKRAVSGFSMSATSSLLLAEHNPGFYDAVGSFSGCAATSTPLPSFFVGLTVNRAGGNITPESLWGPMGSDYNRYNDALVMAEHLRGTKLYISSGTGLTSETDTIGYLKNQRGLESSRAFTNHMTLLVEGGAIEGAMNACTHDLRAKLNAKNIPATFKFRATGTHSWPSWLEDLELSWEQVIKPALFSEE